MVRRKVVEEAERCPTCDKITKHEKKVFFCDYCDGQMSARLDGEELRTTLFKHPSGSMDTTDYYFCSWKCFWAWILENQGIFQRDDFYFFNFPHLMDTNQEMFFKVVQSLTSTARIDE